MTDYTPPNTFYTQVYGLFDNEDMYKFIGKNGAHFKYLTTKLGLDYIWWKKETNVIEIWGPHQKLKYAKKIIEMKLKNYMEKKETIKCSSNQICNEMKSEDLKIATKSFVDCI